jgi:hypothetical protein
MIVFESLLFGAIPVSALRLVGQLLVVLLVGYWFVYPAVKSLLKSLRKKASVPLPSSSSPKKNR